MDREHGFPPFAEDALSVLKGALGDAGDGLPKSEAKALLANDDRFSESDAAHALDMLQNHGRIYYADEQVYITPTDD